ncbi:MAG: M3 family metallopeptidase [Betaproteobacteria bacterium]|nr:MAG: M3 family metallopeptidase [Betaproteobacteria bacterium]
MLAAKKFQSGMQMVRHWAEMLAAAAYSLFEEEDVLLARRVRRSGTRSWRAAGLPPPRIASTGRGVSVHLNAVVNTPALRKSMPY